jgi:hypothetical protein
MTISLTRTSRTPRSGLGRLANRKITQSHPLTRALFSAVQPRTLTLTAAGWWQTALKNTTQLVEHTISHTTGQLQITRFRIVLPARLVKIHIISLLPERR